MLGVGAQGTHRADTAPNPGGSQFFLTELQAQSFPGLWAPCSLGQHREACATFPTHFCNVPRRCLTLITALHHGPGLLGVCVLWGSWAQPLRTGPHCTASQPYTAWPCQDPALHWLRVIDSSIFAFSPCTAPPSCSCTATYVFATVLCAMLLSPASLLHWACGLS